MRKRSIAVLSIIALAVTGITGYAVYNSNRVVPAEVRTREIEKGNITATLLSSGKITSENSKSYFGSNLLVKEVYVKVGDRVEAGTPLVAFDTTDLETAVKQAEIQKSSAALQRASAADATATARKTKSTMESQLSAAKAALAASERAVEEAKKNLVNTELVDTIIEEIKTKGVPADTVPAVTDPALSEEDVKLLNSENFKIIIQEIIKQNELSTVISSLSQALAQVPAVSDSQVKLLDNSIRAADLALTTARNRLVSAKGVLTAEFPGIVTYVGAVEGSYATVQTAAVTIKDDRTVYVAVELVQNDALKVSPGMPAKITYGGKEYSGSLSYLNPAATSSQSPLTGVSVSTGEPTLGAKVKVDSPQGMIIDFSADVEITLDERADVVSVPVEAVIFKKGGITTVFTVENGIATEKEFEAGLSSVSSVEVVSGLEAGAMVVLNPPEGLASGEAVNVK
jgi:HlyD family secretion protein